MGSKCYLVTEAFLTSKFGDRSTFDQPSCDKSLWQSPNKTFPKRSQDHLLSLVSEPNASNNFKNKHFRSLERDTCITAYKSLSSIIPEKSLLRCNTTEWRISSSLRRRQKMRFPRVNATMCFMYLRCFYVMILCLKYRFPVLSESLRCSLRLQKAGKVSFSNYVRKRMAVWLS